MHKSVNFYLMSLLLFYIINIIMIPSFFLMIFFQFFSVIIGICWLSGSVVGFLPLMGWHRESERCFFLQVMNLNYLVFLYFGTIITPAILLIAFYYHIYQVILKQVGNQFITFLFRILEIHGLRFVITVQFNMQSLQF